MQEWFTQQEQLQYKLGLEYDHTLDQSHPEVKASLVENSGGYCPVCYDELSEETAFEMDKCKHTFCRACWADYLN